MIYESKFLLALVITVLIEVPVLMMVLPLFDEKKLAMGKLIFIGVIASGFTLPYLWFVLPNFLPANDYIFWGEIIITLIEALIYFVLLKVGVLRALVASIVANAASYFAGLHIIKYLLTIF